MVMKFDIGEFYENCEPFNFLFRPTKFDDHFTQKNKYIFCLFLCVDIYLYDSA
jgi:hypothetical protein